MGARASLGELSVIGRMRMEELGALPARRSLLPPEDAARNIEPTAERKKHDEVERLEKQIVDARGMSGAPYVVLSPLAAMERNQTISRQQRNAGDKFHDAFRRAMLDQRRAAALIRGPTPVVWWGQSLGNTEARRRVAEAIRALGGEGAVGANLVWHVLGLEWSLKFWIENQRIARISNKSVASGILIGALDVLVREFGA